MGGWAISKNEFQHSKKCWEKKNLCKGNHEENKYRVSAFYYQGPVFDFFKKMFHKLLPTKTYHA